MCLDMLGIKIIPLPCRHNPQKGGFTPDPKEAERLVTEKTRAIVLVTPNNRKMFPNT
jgi:aspartate/methionine/tyrosine aminotransferase